ncbi:MAG TPA: hypothetical protein V6D05_07930 [Stenomitos sp.]
MDKLTRSLGAVLLGVVAGTLVSVPAWAQVPAEPYSPARFAGPKPSGAIGTFAWYATGTFSAADVNLVGNAFLPGLALNVWFTPWLSAGAWGTTGAFGGTIGPVASPFTNAELELKAKLFQTGAGLFGSGLTADFGGVFRTIGIGSGTSPKLGAIFDMNLPARFALQARLDWAPWLYVNGLQTNVFDYKLGVGHPLWPGFGLDVGLRGQAVFAPGNTMSLTGPYIGVGYVF